LIFTAFLQNLVANQPQAHGRRLLVGQIRQQRLPAFTANELGNKVAAFFPRQHTPSTVNSAPVLFQRTESGDGTPLSARDSASWLLSPNSEKKKKL